MNPYDQGHDNCGLDACENAPFASIGGLDARSKPERPPWIADDDWPEFLQGYADRARIMYGDDWRTCEFDWKAALTIPGTDGRED